MAFSKALVLATLVVNLSATPNTQPSSGTTLTSTWNPNGFTSWVAFGDSYTDDSRLSYFSSHNGAMPPVGWDNPANYMSSSGGRQWPQYVQQYAGVKLYNYAVGGAVCSNDITPRNAGSDWLFPAVEQYELTAFLADSQHTSPDGTKFIINPPDQTVYSIWIGTNDLGKGAFLTDSQLPGTTISDYTDCVFRQIKRIYDHGGRYFVIQNVAPLNLLPMYALPGQGGVYANPRYWPDQTTNIAKLNSKMTEQVATVNDVYKHQTAALAKSTDQFGGAHFALMDMHALITDMYNHPTQYLNGTAPANVTGTVKRCTLAECQRDDSPDSYLWFDPLHPSEQAGRTFATAFVDVVQGKSKYATYW